MAKEEHKFRRLPIESLRPNPRNPRQFFDPSDLDDLANSVREKGVVQPILVRRVEGAEGSYEIIAGERRRRAAEKARLHEVPVVVHEASDKEALELAIIENVQRADLNPLEEARGYQQLIDDYGYSAEQLANVIGKSRSYVANTLSLLRLPEAVQDYVRGGKLTAGHARTLVNTAKPVDIAKRIVDQGMSVRDAENLRRSRNSKSVPVARRKDHDILEVEKVLSKHLGVAVTIIGRSNAGYIKIVYKTLEQLDDICRRLQSAPAKPDLSDSSSNGQIEAPPSTSNGLETNKESDQLLTLQESAAEPDLSNCNSNGPTEVWSSTSSDLEADKESDQLLALQNSATEPDLSDSSSNGQIEAPLSTSRDLESDNESDQLLALQESAAEPELSNCSSNGTTEVWPSTSSDLETDNESDQLLTLQESAAEPVLSNSSCNGTTEAWPSTSSDTVVDEESDQLLGGWQPAGQRSAGQNRRKLRRRILARKGEIHLSGADGPAVVSCVVRDISPEGAQLLVSTILALPSDFKLSVKGSAAGSVVRDCLVKWRSNGRLGVQFRPESDQTFRDIPRSARVQTLTPPASTGIFSLPFTGLRNRWRRA